MDAQGGGGFGEVVGVSFQSILDIELFELRHRFIEQNAPVEHFIYQSFHSVAHIHLGL